MIGAIICTLADTSWKASSTTVRAVRKDANLSISASGTRLEMKRAAE